MTLDDIIKNTELNDDLTFKIGDQDVTLGALRGVSHERDQFRSSADSLTKERDQYRADYETLGRTVNGLLSKADEAASRPDNPSQPVDLVGELVKRLAPPDETDKLLKDPLFGKTFDRFRGQIDDSYSKRFDDVGKRLDDITNQMKGAVEALSNSQIYEREQRWYHDNRTDIPTGEDGKKLNLDQLKDFATRNQMFIPNTRLIDFDRALDTLTAPVRQRAEITKIQEEAFQKGLEAGRRGKAQVLPLFGDRSGGADTAPEYNTKGKSSRQMISERISQGLADLTAEAGNQ